MSTNTQDIVAKLWNLCNILKDGGISYHQYFIELTYLLFLKMAQETGTEDQLPEGYRWDNLKEAGSDQLDFYRQLLEHLGNSGSTIVREIFVNADSSMQRANTLDVLVEEIDKLDWYNARQEGMGDIYEGLLAKNASESKAGAGQYFTPRPLIDCMVQVMHPTSKDIIQDPAAGTAGFLIAADRYIQSHEDVASWTKARQSNYQQKTFYGVELVPDTYRLACMNLMLHGIDSDPQGRDWDVSWRYAVTGRHGFTSGVFDFD
ncbi:MAG: class I SAM-dependent DNA methyltransferase [Thermosynechococcaceae cyanobacterium]